METAIAQLKFHQVRDEKMEREKEDWGAVRESFYCFLLLFDGTCREMAYR